jgi:predicted DNA-binding antitoxin AbrB/MazE fold protein
MPLTVEAIWENGVLKPVQPLPFREHERVQITVQPKSNWVEETYGIMGWKGDADTLERVLAETEEPEELP